MAEPINAPEATNGDSLSGFLFALTAYLLWGFLPFFMKAVAHIPAAEVVAHAMPVAQGAIEWIIGAAGSGLVGLAIGAVLIPITGYAITPIWKTAKGLVRPARTA